MKQRKLWIPILLFLVLLGIRMFFSLQIPFLSDDSYLHLETSLEGGSAKTANFVFYYFLAFILFLSKNAVVIKLFSNIFFALTSVMIYFIALRLSKHRAFSFIAALISGFLPIFFSKTFNSLTPLSFGLFLLFFNIYAYLKSDKKPWNIIYVISFVIFSFSHWLVIVYILGLAVYHLLLRIEGIKQEKSETELSLFSIFFGLWAQILLYKKVLLLHGINVLTFNLPAKLFSTYFPAYSFSTIMTFLGIIPFIAGLYIIYKYSFEKKGREITFVISFIALFALLFWLNFCFTDIALILLGLFFCILLARWFVDFIQFVKKTKSAKYVYLFLFMILILIAGIVIPASLYYTNLNLKESKAYKVFDSLEWIKYNAPGDAVILSLPEEGPLITFFTGRNVVMTNDFFNNPDADKKLDDIYRIYKTRFATEAVELLNKYKVSYILFSDNTKKELGIDDLQYVDSSWCFSLGYEGNSKVYVKNPDCRLRVVK